MYRSGCASRQALGHITSPGHDIQAPTPQCPKARQTAAFPALFFVWCVVALTSLKANNCLIILRW